jgi:hypothetical protein
MQVPGYGFIMVGLKTVRTTLFEGRRLLSSGQDWSHTGICEALSTAQNMGVTDARAWAACIHWRNVGERIIE